MFKLVIQDDEGKTTVVPLIRDEITIGRKEGNTIRLTERNVSRRHARILRNNGEVHIEDLGSYNGIRVNNARIAERVSLRVSDQVQIGDYKLYLKAEGVEQVDDARTMPIERVGNDVGANTATDIIPAIPANAAPTAPIPVQQVPPGIAATPAPGTLPGAPRLVGDPNRTLVAVADTDPHGRPVATAAAVAAMTAPVGYGKLVVLSSNFAGKEFELSRPQMIVGRTDENDIVVNHRSISRNHAKLVREPDTGRYTISDLQSSNGVRVNGQDYGKVELRRGDVVDLGHVRLRFVEPGEDFVFARDAVITDVPETGSKKGVLVAVVCAFLVLGGIGLYFALKGPDKPSGNDQGSGTNTLIAVIDAPQVAVGEQDATQQVEPPPVIDAGSNATSSTDAAKAKEVECRKIVITDTGSRWSMLGDCGRELANLGEKAKGQEFIDRAVAEAKASRELDEMRTKIGDKSLKAARTHLDKIADNSVYRQPALSEFGKAETAAVNRLVADLKRMTRDCKSYRTRLNQAEVTDGGDVASQGRAKVKCEEPPPPPLVKTCVDTGCGSDEKCNKDTGKCVKAPVVKKDICDNAAAVSEAEAKGTTSFGNGAFAAAAVAWKSILRCKPDLLPRLYMAACKARTFCDAKAYYSSMGSPNGPAQICLKEGFDPRNPDDLKKFGCPP